MEVSFCRVGSGNQVQVIRLRGKCLCPRALWPAPPCDFKSFTLHPLPHLFPGSVSSRIVSTFLLTSFLPTHSSVSPEQTLPLLGTFIILGPEAFCFLLSFTHLWFILVFGTKHCHEQCVIVFLPSHSLSAFSSTVHPMSWLKCRRHPKLPGSSRHLLFGLPRT